jgi:hypothetical protein
MLAKTSTDGYADMVLKNRTTADRRIYHWSAKAEAYAPAP